MKKREFLKATGLLGAFGLFPGKSLLAADETERAKAACVLIPSETAGPFPLDLTENTTFFRSDIRDSKTGIPFNLKIKVIGKSNCLPLQNVRVNIWHCDKDGLYSGYSQTNNPGQAGLTYLRGYQYSDANGEVNFISIFPGWYTGRICHIHFQVYVSSQYSAVSQMTFDVATKNSIYSSNSSLYTKGADPMSLSSDNIFSDGYEYQLATLTPNTSTGGYDGYLEVTVEGSGTTGFGLQEKINSQQFSLGQNFPNPHTGLTKIPFELKFNSDIQFKLFDLNGKEMVVVKRKGIVAGKHDMDFNFEELGLPLATYAYEFEVRNSNGIFREVKLMSSLK